MKASDYNTIAARGALHPHGHTQKNEGPWSLRIGVKSQPTVIRDWKAKQVLLSIEQPNEGDNLTLICVLYLRSGTKKPSLTAGLTFHRARQYRRPNEVIEVRVKRRYGSSFPHPVPVGKYTGACIYDVDGGFGVFTFQTMTLKKEPGPQKPKTIITPGDAEYGQSLADIKRAFPGVDGLGRGGVDAGGLRDG
jgi:hypothetical protein